MTSLSEQQTGENLNGIGEWVQGRQSNHEPYFRPAILTGYPVLPLYRAVALWGWLTGSVVSVQTLQTVFRLERRRADDVVRYLSKSRKGMDVERVALRPLRLRIRHVAFHAPLKVCHQEAESSLTNDGGLNERRTVP